MIKCEQQRLNRSSNGRYFGSPQGSSDAGQEAETRLLTNPGPTHHQTRPWQQLRFSPQPGLRRSKNVQFSYRF